MMSWHQLQYLKPEKIKRLQDKLLRNFIRGQIPYHPFYHNLFKKNNISFSGIKTTDDLKKLPFTTKEDVAPTAKEPKKFLDFVLQPNEQLIRQYAAINKKIKIILNKNQLYQEYKPTHIHFTTGRTANATPILYTAYDLQRLEESGRRMMQILNVSSSDIAINAFPYAPHLAFWQTFYATKGANLLSLHTGGGKILGTDRIIKSMESMKATCLAGMPGYLYHLIRTAKEQKNDLSSLNLIIFGGERVPSGLRDKIKEFLMSMGSKAPRILSTYAFTEGKCAWVECKEESGYHLYPDFEFIEIVDKNNERVNEGEKGEIVYTSLDWRGSVFLRYKTGDITEGLYYEKCSCGRALPRIGAAIERSSEYKEFKLAKIKGSFVNLNAFFPIMMAHKDIEEWQIEIRKKNNDPYEIDELIVYVAPRKNANFEKLRSDLKDRITAETEVTPQIVKAELTELLKQLGMETELKERRIVDKRQNMRTKLA
ncbi:AMP-binding protein [Candidatus Woesearchaeota archaeon]|nr:AMP-binding protein [Candidatus Woesearchaeota archaeon]